MMKILGAQAVRQWEARTITAGRATVESLMREAVEGCVVWWTRNFPVPGRAVFLIGKGHNGHDGLWLATELRLRGWSVEVVAVKGVWDDDFRAPAVAAARALVRTWPDRPDISETGAVPVVWVDALLGIGANGEPRGPVAEILKWVGEVRRPGDRAVAVDVPSGLDVENGRPAEHAFRADWTLMIGAVKSAAMKDSARPFVGRIVPVPLRLDEDGAPESDGLWYGLERARGEVELLRADTHKHRQGRLGVWAGAATMPGAAVLVCRAALASGAGLVRLWGEPELHNIMAGAVPEVILEEAAPAVWPPDESRLGAWVAGPGLGVGGLGSMWRSWLGSGSVPAVLDADGLSFCAEDMEATRKCRRRLVLTPHAGELAKLAGSAVTDRLETAQALAARLPGCVIVAKGPNTQVVCAGRPVVHVAAGNPGLATPGSGDVLAGVIGALLAGGLDPYDAARLGVFLHGQAADILAGDGCERTVTAGGVVSTLGRALRMAGA